MRSRPTQYSNTPLLHHSTPPARPEPSDRPRVSQDNRAGKKEKKMARIHIDPLTPAGEDVLHARQAEGIVGSGGVVYPGYYPPYPPVYPWGGGVVYQPMPTAFGPFGPLG